MAILERLLNPSKEARGWTRWWWYGCAVTREDIDIQLAEMAKAHIGGVEIQVTYPLDYDERAAHRHIEFFSPAFFEILAYLVESAKRHDMMVDLTLGSGWPFGGPFITQDMAPVSLMPFSHDAQGPTNFSFDYTCVLPGDIVRCVLVRIENGVLQADSARDVTDHLRDVELYGWPWGSKLDNVPVPEGAHRIFTFVASRYRQQVGVPAPGMAGHAIDHCRKDVCNLYFHTMGDALIEKLGRDAIHAFFCDSIELGGNNWTGPLLDEFAQRRGYELTPYLPALWADMGDVTPRVRYDYYKTFSELTLENFFGNFAEHCERWGVKSRVQAHGIWADILKAYGVAHIPEGETFGAHDRYDVNTTHRRLAVSAGLVYGRPIVSNESFTWLRMPRFLETPEMVKRAADAIFMDGVNRIVNHGWSYSPRDVEAPGWPFYASSMLSMNNTWWPYYAELGAYIQRVSALMQAAAPHSEVAVYLPQADVWSDSPMAELHMCMKLDEYLGHDAMNLLQRQGYWFTYVNDEALTSGVMTQDGLRIGENTYKACLLIQSTRLPPDTARALDAFVRGGGRLVAAPTYPRRSVGMIDAEHNDAVVANLMDALLDKPAGAWHPVGSGAAARAETVGQPVVDLLDAALTPDLRSDCSEDLGYIRRDIDGAPSYFIANIAAKPRISELSLPHAGAGFRIVDALTLRDIRPLAVSDEAGRLVITLALSENQSFFLEIGAIDGSRPDCAARAQDRDVMRIGNWSIQAGGQLLAEALPSPIGWQTFEASKYHSGEGVYAAVFLLPQLPVGALFLGFGRVDCCCEVFINGQSVGTIWKAPFEIEVTRWIAPGENLVEVRAVNTWFNAFFNPERDEPVEERPVVDEWPYFSRVVDVPRQRRVYGWRERAMIDSVQPSGLDGAVRLFTRAAEGEAT